MQDSPGSKQLAVQIDKNEGGRIEKHEAPGVKEQEESGTAVTRSLKSQANDLTTTTAFLRQKINNKNIHNATLP